MKHGSPLVMAGLMLCSLATGSAEEVKLEWQPDQIYSRLGYYMPLRLQLTDVKPEGVTKIPDGLNSPRYGTLQLGPKETPTKAAVLLDEPDSGPARLWIDRNGNGDLTDDPPTVWEPGKPPSTAKWAGTGSVDATYGGEKRTLGFSLYRFDKADPRRAALKDVLLYYRTFGLSGDITLGGKKYASVLVDDSAVGDFRGSENTTGANVSLLLDVNADGKFDSKAERFDIRAPFNIGGTTYEISGLTANGGSFTIAQSSKTVAERPKAPAIGAKPFAFEHKNTAGANVRFPEDYKDKLVLLDFWATWCGPCIKELPGLTKVYEDFHGRGFEILGVSLDDAKGLEKLPKFTQDKGMTWPQICDTGAWRSPIAAGYSVNSIPAAFLVDGKTGNIVAMGNDLRGERLRATVEQCLAKLGTGTAVATTATPPTPGNTPPAVKPPDGSTLTPTTNDALVAKATELLNAGKLLTAEAFAAQKQNPQPGPVVLAQPGTATLSGREIAKRAGAGYLRAGWFFQCTKCGRWHTNLAGGYAIATDTAVTAHHVLQPPENMKPGVGYPIFVRGDSEVLPITAVLADDAAMDAIVLRVGANDLTPLPLGGDTQMGDNVWCLSDPRGERGYFSNGIVNRFVSRPPGGVAQQRINVSTDWAPGSSGAAILDGAGNVIGHVATIRALFSKPPAHPSDSKPGAAAAPTTGTAMNVHEAIPAKSVLTLIRR